jgi:hypothetical protein
MPSVTMGATGNFFANNMVPSMSMSSGVPPNNFRSSQFRNAHIPLSNPTLGSAFAQTGAQVESNPMLGGGFIAQSYAHYGSAATTRINYIPQTGSPFGIPSVLGEQMFGNNPYYGSNPQSQFQSFPGGNIPGVNAFGGGSSPYQFQQNWNMVQPPKILFLATLNLLGLSKLINDLIRHSPAWPSIPTRLPSDIPKFEGKANEDPNTHVMTFHLWCSSNSLMDDSVRLRIFQRTLMGVAAKWYIELPSAGFVDFGSWANGFLHHFQLPIRYDSGTELLTSFQQGDAINISDHIHEW